MRPASPAVAASIAKANRNVRTFEFDSSTGRVRARGVNAAIALARLTADDIAVFPTTVRVVA